MLRGKDSSYRRPRVSIDRLRCTPVFQRYAGNVVELKASEYIRLIKHTLMKKPFSVFVNE